MQQSRNVSAGGIAGYKEAMQHHSGKTLATAMGSTKQSALSASVSSRAVGPFASAHANTGVTQMLAVDAHQQSLKSQPAKRKAPAQPAATKRSRKDAGPQGAEDYSP